MGNKQSLRQCLFYIRYDGEVYPCSKLPLSLGNINKNALQQILNSSILIKKLKERNLKGKCSNCENKLICGGCRAAAYAEYGDLLQEDPLCEV